MKTARDQLDILTTYQELGSYRAAAALCGTTHKTVRRVVERRGRPQAERAARPRVTDPVLELIAAKVKSTDGRISAKRLLPLCRAEGYTGSGRSLRRAVASARAAHRRQRRAYRPWQPVPGEHLVFDWGTEDGMQVSCAVLAWSRWRFVRFAQRQDQATTLRLLAECFELLGGVPGVLLTDRMGCLKGGVVADVMVPAPGYVAFAAHYGFRVDFCEAGDPESKGVVEHLVGYAKTDLLVGLGPFADLGDANATAVSWCAEVNGRPHSETMAVPDERLLVERTLLGALPSLRPAIGAVETRTVDTLRTVRFRSARYSVPGALIGERVGLHLEGPELVIRHRDTEIARHRLVGPGESSLLDEHYGGPARKPARALRPRTAAELAFLDLGPVAEAFVRAAAAAGTTKLPSELSSIIALERAHGREALIAALERALAHRRFRAADIRAILAAGSGVSRPRAATAGVVVLFADERLLSSDPSSWDQFIREAHEAEAYSRKLSKRVSEGYAAKRRRLGVPGGNKMPFGLVREGKPSVLRVDEEKAAVVIRAYQLAASGSTDWEVAAQTGLAKTHVSEVLTNPIYAGRLRTGEPAAIAPIVDPSLWSTVQTRRERRRTRTPGRIVKGRYALRLCCAGCGKYLFGDIGRYRHPAPTCEGFLAAKPVVRRQRRGNEDMIDTRIKGHSYPQAWYEDAVGELLGKVGDLEDEAMTEIVRLYGEDAERPDELTLARIEREREEASQRLAKTRDIAAWQATMARLDAEQQVARQPRQHQRMAPDEVVAYLRSLPSLWNDAGPEGRQALASAVFTKLEVEGYQKMRYELTPDAVDLGLGAALPARLETGAQTGGFGRGERGSASLAHLRFRPRFVLENVTARWAMWRADERKAG